MVHVHAGLGWRCRIAFQTLAQDRRPVEGDPPALDLRGVVPAAIEGLFGNARAGATLLEGAEARAGRHGQSAAAARAQDRDRTRVVLDARRGRIAPMLVGDDAAKPRREPWRAAGQRKASTLAAARASGPALATGRQLD